MSVVAVVPVMDQRRRVIHTHDEKACVGHMSPASALRAQHVLRGVTGEGTSRTATVASVSRIDQAPSVRQRKALLRQEDPATHRRPVVNRQMQQRFRAEGAVQAQHAGLRLRHLAYVVGYALVIWASVVVGLWLQGSGYTGETVVHSVGSGESVWSLAASVPTDRALEDVVADIQQLNDLSGPLMRGQHIILPVR